MTQFDDAGELQRFVDRELTSAEEAEFLTGLDARPERWRDLALALVEDRVLRDGLGGLAGAGSSPRSAAPSELAAAVDSRSSARGVIVRRVFAAAAVAAAVMIGVFLGRRFVERDDPAASGPDVVVEDGKPVTAPTHSDSEETDGPVPVARVRLSKQDQDGGSPAELTVPVYDASQLAALERGEAEPAGSDDVDGELRRRGYSARSQVRYLQGRLADGRRVVIPTRSVAFYPHGQ